MAAPAAAKSAYADSRSPEPSLRRQASRPAGHPGAALAASSLATQPPILGRPEPSLSLTSPLTAGYTTSASSLATQPPILGRPEPSLSLTSPLTAGYTTSV